VSATHGVLRLGTAPIPAAAPFPARPPLSAHPAVVAHQHDRDPPLAIATVGGPAAPRHVAPLLLPAPLPLRALA